MNAEVLSIGSELTCGQSLDTNAQWISRQLSAVGIETVFHTTVDDDLDHNVDAFAHALTRVDLVVATGGLGPTADDLTRDALARLAGVPLRMDEASMAHIEAIFRYLKRPMPERNRVQAYFPEGAVPIPNPNGTAPGIWMELRGKTIVCLPGVPKEMQPMFVDSVLPKLQAKSGVNRVIVHRTLRCFGAGESAVEQMLGDLTRRSRHPQVGITASEATISLRITATAQSVAAAQSLIEVDERFIREQLGPIVFGAEDQQLQHAVFELLRDRQRTLASAESCTGGLIGHLLTEVAGISQFYLGGVVAYSNQAKVALLEVPADLIERHGAVSPEVAEAMAIGCRHRFGADIGLATTGIAGPGGGTPEKPVGLVYCAIAYPEGTKIARFQWGADRSSTKLRSAKMTLNLARLYLLKGPWPHDDANA